MEQCGGIDRCDDEARGGGNTPLGGGNTGIAGLLQVEVERAQGEENQSFSTIQQRFDMYCLSLCVIPWLRKTNAPPP